jgi:hypothetical protein
MSYETPAIGWPHGSSTGFIALSQLITNSTAKSQPNPEPRHGIMQIPSPASCPRRRLRGRNRIAQHSHSHPAAWRRERRRALLAARGKARRRGRQPNVRDPVVLLGSGRREREHPPRRRAAGGGGVPSAPTSTRRSSPSVPTIVPATSASTRYAYIHSDNKIHATVYGGICREKRRCSSQLFFQNRRIFPPFTSCVTCDILASDILTVVKGGAAYQPAQLEHSFPHCFSPLLAMFSPSSN